VKVADFGLAKRTGVDVDVTAIGARLGTPLYFSPEMAMGEKADARSDLYSLGVTFYHLVAGRLPFKGSSMADIMLDRPGAKVPPLDEIEPHASPALVRAIHRLLERKPENRFQTAQELLDALEGRDVQPSAQAAPVESGSRITAKELRELLILGAVVLALILAVALAVLAW